MYAHNEIESALVRSGYSIEVTLLLNLSKIPLFVFHQNSRAYLDAIELLSAFPPLLFRVSSIFRSLRLYLLSFSVKALMH